MMESEALDMYHWLGVLAMKEVLSTVAVAVVPRYIPPPYCVCHGLRERERPQIEEGEQRLVRV